MPYFYVKIQILENIKLLFNNNFKEWQKNVGNFGCLRQNNVSDRDVHEENS